LIDLLVQIVFIFTLVLLASEALEGTPSERGWVTPEVWKTLVSIFDVSPTKEPEIQAQEIEKRYRDEKKAREELNGRLASEAAKVVDLERQRDELTQKLAKYVGRGGPGNPTCRDEKDQEEVVMNAFIDIRGDIAVSPLSGARELQEKAPIQEQFQRPMTQRSFAQLFVPWRAYGLSRDPKCAYKVAIKFDPDAPAGKYSPAYNTIVRYFNREGEPVGVR